MYSFAVVIPSWDKEAAQKTASNLLQYGNLKAVNQVVISGSERVDNRWGAVQSMAVGASNVRASEILVFAHDDMEIYENWTEYLDLLFTANPDIGLIGLHGSKGLGADTIYRTRYELVQLARYDPISGMVDAEAHGRRVTVPQQVATVDGFFMAVRSEAYKAVGGWEACLQDNIPYHMYDSWMAMVLREHAYDTYLAPISCKHYGGGTEVRKSEEYEKWARENGFKEASEVHTKGHLAFYKRFSGQLPIRIT